MDLALKIAAVYYALTALLSLFTLRDVNLKMLFSEQQNTPIQTVWVYSVFGPPFAVAALIAAPSLVVFYVLSFLFKSQWKKDLGEGS